MKKICHTKKTKAKHLEKSGKYVLNKQTRQEANEYFESFAGLLKGDVIGELIREKEIEKKL